MSGMTQSRSGMSSSLEILALMETNSALVRRLTVEKTASGETFVEEADFVVSCRGNLNDFAWPDISGIESFRGEKMHSAAWNDR